MIIKTAHFLKKVVFIKFKNHRLQPVAVNIFFYKILYILPLYFVLFIKNSLISQSLIPCIRTKKNKK